MGSVSNDLGFEDSDRSVIRCVRKPFKKSAEPTHYSRTPPYPAEPPHTFCGRNLTHLPGLWCFESVEHALMNHRNGRRLVACPQCLRELRKTLDQMIQLSDAVSVDGRCV